MIYARLSIDPVRQSVTSTLNLIEMVFPELVLLAQRLDDSEED